ncbi:MAG: hypothetical protein QXW00_03220 [Candidatus Woesearchaeota archaeon]
MRRILNLLMLLTATIILGASLAAAAPIGPDEINVTGSSRRASTGPKELPALAGNVTELSISAVAVTNIWQGYYGNITGTIVLDNANNKTMYSWNDMSPSGEIYAVRTSNSVNWASISCANTTHIAEEEAALNIQPNEKDGIDETFNQTVATDFYVGTTHITSCDHAQYLYENDAPATSNNFLELLLHDGNYVIYTALINQDKLGFDGATHDFQLMVPEDGHNGDTSATMYYFYVELN